MKGLPTVEAPCHPEPGAGVYSAESQLGRLDMARAGNERPCALAEKLCWVLTVCWQSAVLANVAAGSGQSCGMLCWGLASLGLCWPRDVPSRVVPRSCWPPVLF